LTTSNASSTYAPISSLSSYLTTSNASSTYATIASLSSYLTTSNASSTYAPISSLSSYLTTSNASSTYAPLIVNNSYYLTGCNPTIIVVTGAPSATKTVTTPLYPFNTYNASGFSGSLNIVLPLPTSSFSGFLFTLRKVSGSPTTQIGFSTSSGSNMIAPNGVPAAAVLQYNFGAQNTYSHFQAVCLLSQTANTYYWYCLPPTT